MIAFNDSILTDNQGMLDDVFKNLEHSENDQDKRYQSISHLWKTDDPEWVEQRENEWRLLLEDGICDGCRAKTKKAWQAFYIYGEEPPIDTSMSQRERYFMTPFTTVDEAQEVYSLITHPTDRHGHSHRSEYTGSF